MDKNILTNRFCGVFVCAIMLFVAQAFALDCKTGTGWGDFLTQEASKGSDGYYQIDTPEKLAWISCKVRHDNGAFAKAKVKLTQSIDMQGKVFIPIAAGDKQKFSGTIDGQGFTISNLYINGSEINNNDTSSVTKKPRNGEKLFGQNIGLVGVLNGGTIKNLTLKDAQIYAAIDAGSTGNDKGNPISVGTLVGWVDNASTIENCVASGSIETSGAKNRVGGIVGNVKNITITNCVSSVSVTASGDSTYVGGIVGALRNGGTVNMSSCVYSGNSLYTVDGSVGAIAGSYESVGSIKTEDLYYSDDFCEKLKEGEECSGLGYNPKNSTFNTTSTENLNSEEVVCNLNSGTWNEGVCTGDTSEVWSVGQSNVSMNGSDGYKITFNANGGSFASGAKTSKVLVKNATITADEIGVPTREGKKFAGWATTANAGEPSDLGVVNAATIIYAVWYDFYQVTFNTGCDTAFSDAKFPDSTKTKTISVAKHGTVSVDGFSVPTVYEIGTDENKVKYYFTGWAYAPKSFDVNETIAETDTLHLSAIDVTAPVTLYAVWTKAPTFSVTFDASLHGKTEVHFVKMVTEGETVSRPDTVITDAGYKVVGWCEVENCTEENEYSFADSLKGNLVLHARWEIESYSIEYELAGGVNAEGNPSTYNINSGDIVFAAPTKEGATFDGWFYDQEFTNPATQIGAGSTGDKKIYAKWTVATYTIQYLSGTAISATVPGTTKTYGDTITLRDAPSQFAVGGCTFDGWSKVDYGQEGYAVDYAFGAKYADNANLKLFPHWVCSNTYTITYEMYGVNATNRNPSTYTGPVKITLENAFVSNDQVKMDNWYLEPTFKTSIRNLQGINDNMTLYAKWYNVITFQPGTKLKNFNKGAGKVEKQKDLNKTYTLGIPNTKYAIENYTLDGWSLTDGGEKVYDVGFDYTDNVNITLYPHWVENPVVTHYGAVTIEKYSDKTIAKIDGEYTGEDAVEINRDIEVNSVTLNRKFNKNQISTLMLPFEIDAENVVGSPVYKYKTMVRGDDGRWKFKITAATKIYANTPYVVLPTESNTLSFKIEKSVKFNTKTESNQLNSTETSEGTWEYKGVYAYTSFEDHSDFGNIYVFANEPQNEIRAGQFVKAGTGSYANPMRAYLVLRQQKALAKSAGGSLNGGFLLPNEIDIEIDDENGETVQTGKLDMVTGEFRMDRWYDLKGRKLNSKPSVKGTYYKNGKKVIIK